MYKTPPLDLSYLFHYKYHPILDFRISRTIVEFSLTHLDYM
jgi:hypothetical protein